MLPRVASPRSMSSWSRLLPYLIMSFSNITAMGGRHPESSSAVPYGTYYKPMMYYKPTPLFSSKFLYRYRTLRRKCIIAYGQYREKVKQTKAIRFLTKRKRKSDMTKNILHPK